MYLYRSQPPNSRISFSFRLSRANRSYFEALQARLSIPVPRLPPAGWALIKFERESGSEIRPMVVSQCEFDLLAPRELCAARRITFPRGTVFACCQRVPIHAQRGPGLTDDEDPGERMEPLSGTLCCSQFVFTVDSSRVIINFLGPLRVSGGRS